MELMQIIMLLVVSLGAVGLCAWIRLPDFICNLIGFCSMLFGMGLLGLLH